MSALPLSSAELAWLVKLEKIMKACPSERLAAFTIGDNDLVFFDIHVRDKWQLQNPREQLDAGTLCEVSGSKLHEVYGAFLIESSCG